MIQEIIIGSQLRPCLLHSFFFPWYFACVSHCWVEILHESSLQFLWWNMLQLCSGQTVLSWVYLLTLSGVLVVLSLFLEWSNWICLAISVFAPHIIHIRHSGCLALLRTTTMYDKISQLQLKHWFSVNEVIFLLYRRLNLAWRDFKLLISWKCSMWPVWMEIEAHGVFLWPLENLWNSVEQSLAVEIFVALLYMEF